MAEINISLYSREVMMLGMETMGKLMQMKVFISGFKGLGVETAKNLILARIGKVTLHDDHIVEKKDLGANFYLTEAHIGTISRARASFDQLQALNNYVRVDVKEGDFVDEAFLSQFSVVLLTESDQDTITLVNEICRRHNVGFISSEVTGAAGYVFLDYGNSFPVFDKTGEENKSFIIANITQGNPGIVTVHDEKRHTYEDGDYVIFKEVQGMTEINAIAPRPVKYISQFTFSVGDTSTFSEYQREGIVEQVKVPVQLEFRSYADSLKNPVIADPLITADLGKFGRPEQLHIAYQALRAFQQEHHRLPAVHNAAETDQVVHLAKEINAAQKDAGHFNVEAVEEAVVRKLALFSQLHVSPLAAFFGGVVAQEIVKFTGKYTPLRQWLYIDWFEIIEPEVERPIVDSRFHDQIALIGIEAHNKLARMNIFLAGAGALGCEYLKGFALMGASSNGGLMTVTDEKNITVSNLSSHFLFRKENVSHSKSACAAAVVKTINPTFNVIALQDHVRLQNEHIFNDAFWESLDLVVGAMDNTTARLYVDSRCVWYTKRYLDTGTFGTKSCIEVIIPHKTQSYGDSPDPPEEQVPMDIPKNFPHAIEHCIEWSKIEFEGSFSDGPKEVLKFIEDPQRYLTHLPSITSIQAQRQKLETIKRLLEAATDPTFQTCVNLARQMFEDLFHKKILQLLHHFPVDYQTSDGLPFWTKTRRAPEACVFDPEDPDYLSFIVSTANLYAYMFGIPQIRDRDHIKILVRHVPITPFNPEVKEISEAPELSDEQVLGSLINDLQGILQSLTPITEIVIKVSDFEKDDDSNFHIDFIHSAASLRARNYRIPVTDRLNVRKIAGRIAPGIVMTPAMTTGGALIEIYKLALDLEVEMHRDFYINLALPMFAFSEPMPPKKTCSKDYDPVMMGQVRAYPEGYTRWDKLAVESPCTLAQLINQLREKHGLKVMTVGSSQVMIYNRYLAAEKHVDRLLEPVHKLYKRLSEMHSLEGKRSLALEVSCEADGIDVTVPTIKYFF